MSGEEAADRSIAIVGMAGRFPKAGNPGELWRNVLGGRESISVLEADPVADPDRVQEQGGDASISAHGLLERVEHFDDEFFAYTRREAVVADPQQRLLLEVAWSALEDAGYRPDAQPRTGLFVGARPTGYAELAGHQATAPGDSLIVSIGTDPTFFSTRISYKLGLKGPSLNVQTACSSSLVAVHLAANALRNGECDLALAGGVCIHPERTTSYVPFEGSIMSTDGHCRPFDAAANGTVGGEGVAVVVLKRLPDALEAGDAVYAVLRGTAVNNDGHDKIGFTAPSVRGQVEVIRAALADARVEPASVGYVEAHGTGTALGDPIELEALHQVFAGGRLAPLAIGSVKASIGHLDAAAGVASLIKATLAISEGVIPPLVNFSELNPNAPQNHVFMLPLAASSWPAEARPRRAGVSAFGIGGTNAHVVLEEAPHLTRLKGPAAPQVLVFSARTQADLEATTAAFDTWIQSHPDVSLEDVAYTLQVGRKPFGYRSAIVASSADPTNEEEPRSWKRRAIAAAAPSAGIVMAFSGQGTQRSGLVSALYARHRVFADCVDELLEGADPTLRQHLLGSDLPSRADDPRPATPRIAQPAIFVEEFAIATLLRAWGLEPLATTGNSLGEYAGACVAGVFAPRDAVDLLTLRGDLCSRCPEGAMLAVAGGADAIRPILSPDVWIAVDAAPGRCTVSGDVGAIEDLQRDLNSRGIASTRLPVDRAYHSPLLRSIADEYAKEVAARISGLYTTPVVSSVRGTWLTETEATSPKYWAYEHLLDPVRLGAAMDALSTLDATILNVGPYDGQLRSARTVNTEGKRDVIATAPAAPTEEPAELTLLAACARAWTAGSNVDWRGIDGNAPRARVHLPTYPFAGPRHWPKTLEPGTEAESIALSPSNYEVTNGSVPEQLAADVLVTPATENPRLGTDTVEVITMMFDEVLGTFKADEAASFFELGGDSLTASQVVARLRDTYAVTVTLREFFENSSAIALAQRIDELVGVA